MPVWRGGWLRRCFGVPAEVRAGLPAEVPAEVRVGMPAGMCAGMPLWRRG